MDLFEIREKMPVAGTYDILVAGGGVAGVAAALAAARAGKKVLLLEKSTILGGLATLGRSNLFVAMCNGRGRQIVTGMAEELLRLAIRYGFDTLPAEWRNGEPDGATTVRYVTRFSAGIFALALTEQIVAEGIDLLYDCIASHPVMDGKHCCGVIVESKSGRALYEAGVVVDTTGDADLLFRAGVPVVQGGNFFTYSAHGISLDSCRKAVASGRINDAEITFSGGTATLHGKNHPQGMPLFPGTTVENISEYLIRNQRLLLQQIKDDERFSRDILTLPGMAQFRTTRRIAADYTLQVADQYQHFPDSVGAICDFWQRDFIYEVPYRCLVHQDYDNLITAGRSAAAEGYAWDVLRVIPPAILTGQAAGLAAAQSLSERLPIHAIDINTLQQTLSDAGVMVHFNDDLVPDKPSTGSPVENGGQHEHI
ncbi:MAG: FAD-dependent oxidoreductase [Ruminococcaceae bacterium]|nr:FAD-dependent oxidoreductase [Oscillospiraceae bacterium]